MALRVGRLALIIAAFAIYVQLDRLLRPGGVLPGLPKDLAPKAGNWVQLSHAETFYQLTGPEDGKMKEVFF